MSKIDLTSYSKEDISYALRLLRNYKNSYIQIGKRAHFVPVPQDKVSFRVQHTDALWEQEVASFASSYISRFFPHAQNPHITYEINNTLKGGIRIFYGDDMIDVSFQRYSQLISF